MPNVNPPQINPEEHHHHHKILYAVIGVFLIIVIAGAIAWYQEEKKTAQNSNLETSNKQQENLTSEWKTYMNTEYGFEIKYPSEWNVKGVAQWREFNDPSNTSVLKIERLLNYDNVKSGDIKYIKDYVSSLDDYLCTDEEGPCSEIEAAVKKAEGWTLQKSSETVVDKAPAMKYEYVKGSSSSNIYYVVGTNDMFYEIGLTNTGSKDLNTLNQILSTFKFIGTDANISTAGWKIYRDAEYQFEFRYPNNLTYTKSSEDSFDNTKWMKVNFYNLDKEEFLLEINTPAIGFECDDEGKTENKTINNIHMEKKEVCDFNIYKFETNDLYMFITRKQNSSLDQVVSTFKFID